MSIRLSTASARPGTTESDHAARRKCAAPAIRVNSTLVLLFGPGMPGSDHVASPFGASSRAARITESIAKDLNECLSGIVINASTCLRMLSANPPNARETARRTIGYSNRAAEAVSHLPAGAASALEKECESSVPHATGRNTWMLGVHAGKI